MPIEIMRDLRWAWRQLLKNPGFSVLAITTLALGIGASSAVFSLVRSVLLAPPPYTKPDELILIAPARQDGRHYTRAWPAAQWQEWRKEGRSLAALAGYAWTFNFLVLPDGSESIEGLWVTSDYFRVLGVQPALGRAFLESEASAKPAPVIILGHDLWKRRFNGDKTIVGQTIRISRNPAPFTVVGVMPPDVRFLPAPGEAQEPNYDLNAKVDYWLPASTEQTKPKDPEWNLVGRRAAGISLAQTQAEISALAARQAHADHDFDGIVPVVQPLALEVNREGRRLLLPVVAAVVLVFLVSCANAAGLMLARGLQRQHEYAIRSALGARPAQLCRQTLMESALLALAGGLAGAALAFAGVQTLKQISGTAIPKLDAVHVGWAVLLFCFGTALVAGIVAGLLPAWRSITQRTASGLKENSSNSSVGRLERRLLSSVAILQIGLTLGLLVGAGLLVRTTHALARIRPGYDTENLLTMSVTAVQTNWMDFHQRALERVSRLPGVKKAAFAWGVPLTGNRWNTTFQLTGEPATSQLAEKLTFPSRAVTPDYFEAIGLPVVAGRNFRPTDSRETQAVLIINQALADRHFPGMNPVGRKLYFPGNLQQPLEIVGVVADARMEILTEPAEPSLYFPLWQAQAFSKHLVLRTQADPRALAATVQQELRAVDPSVAIERIKTLEQIREESVSSRIFAMRLLLGFSMMAGLLAVVGIYGVLSLTVGARNREIAIRLAIGAQRTDVVRLVLRDGLRLAMVGTLVGTTVAIILAGALRTFLFGVVPWDPITFCAMICTIIVVTLLTCWVPARRATRIDPIEALRYE